jgi:WD40 repeat protein
VAGSAFISYSSRDLDVAREVEQLLMSAEVGWAPWRDEQRLERDWSDEIAQALARSDALVLLWSAQAAQSRWVRNEWLTARALEKPIVPLLADATPLPPPLATLHGLVLDGGPPPAAALAARLAAGAPDYDFTIRPDGVRIPLAPNPDFVGRGADLLELYLALIGDLNKVGVRSVGSVGMGGVGKTQLAVEFVHRFAFAFDGVQWLNAAEDDWVRLFRELARDELRLDAGPAPSDRDWIRALAAHCAEHPGLLLVLDNVTDPNRLNEPTLLGTAPLSLGCNLLFTTRRQFDLPGVASRAVDILPEPAALELLAARRGPIGAGELEDARAICAAVGFLPLALVLAAAYLGRYPAMGYDGYRRHLSERRLDTLDVQSLSAAQLATRHEAAVHATLEDQWSAVTGDKARLLFVLAGQLGEAEVIPAARLGLLAGIDGTADDLVRPLDDACLELSDLSLAEPADDGRSLRLHPLVREFAQTLVADAGAARAEAAARLAGLYADAGVLERHFAARGADGVIADVGLALEWSSPDPAPLLAELADVLSAESAALYRFRHEQHPALFLQQVGNRAASRGYATLSSAALGRLEEAGAPHFAALWRTQVCSRSLARTIVTRHSAVTAMVMPGSKEVVTCSREPHPVEDTGAVLELWDVDTGRLVASVSAGFVDAVAALDAEHVLTAGDDVLRLWHMRSGASVRELEARGRPSCLAISPDRRTALSTDADDGALLRWDLDRWAGPWELDRLAEGTAAIAFTPDGRHAIVGWADSPLSGDSAGGLGVWDVVTGERVPAFDSPELSVAGVAVGDDWIVSVGDERWRRWDLETGRLEADFPLKSGTAACALPRRRAAVAGERDVLAVDVDTGEVLAELAGHAEDVLTIDCLSADRIVTGGADGTARIWRLSPESGGVPVISGHGSAVAAGVALDDVAVTAAEGGDCRLWDLRNGEALHEWRERRGAEHAVVARGAVLTSRLLGDEKGIVVRDVDAGTARLVWPTQSGAERVALAGNGMLLVAHGSSVDILELRGSGPTVELEPSRPALALPPRFLVTDAAATPDASRVAVAGFDENHEAAVLVFDAISGQRRAAWRATSSFVRPIAISDDGEHVAFLDERSLNVWTPAGGEPPSVLAEVGSVVELMVLPGGLLACAGTDLRVWEIATRELRMRAEGHRGGLHLEPLDGWRLLVAAEDWTVSVWDLERGRELATVALDGAARVATVAPDGRTVLCGDGGGDVYAFQLTGLPPAAPSDGRAAGRRR